jgi:adenylylsulfate kinase-like enzyme
MSIKSKELGDIVWITGLSGAGKTTLATNLVKSMRNAGESIIFLDGDILREVFGHAEINQDSHTRENRLKLAMRYSSLCQIIAKQGINVVIATISLFHEVHQWNRENLPNYFEIYLKVPIEELKRRDSKGIYGQYYKGLVKNVAGIDLPVDEPKSPDLVINYDQHKSSLVVANEILSFINNEWRHNDNVV